MSQWFCRVLGQEWGPLSFADLAEMLRAGTLSEDDLVRRDGTSECMKARNVVGLLHTVRASVEDAPSAAADQGENTGPHPYSVDGTEMRPTAPLSAAVRERSDRTAIPRMVFRRRGQGWAIGLAVIVAAAALLAWGPEQSEVFPTPRGMATANSNGFHVPLLGSVSLIEYVLLWLDLILAAAVAAWLCRRWLHKPLR